MGLLAVGLAAILALQHHANAELHEMIAVLRDQHREVDRLRAERERLVRTQIPAAELAGLRADHAAIAQLRGEIATAKARLREAESVPAPQP